MKPNRSLHRIASLAVLMLAATLTAQAQTPLKIVPKDAEAIIGVNVRQIVHSDFFKKFQGQHPEIEAHFQNFENLTGINIPEDAEQLVFFGKLNNKEYSGVIYTGKFDKEKMLTLFKSNPKFKESTAGNLAAYEWFDNKEKQKKFAFIVTDTVMVVCNSQAASEACTAAVEDDAASFAATPDAGRVPQGAEKAGAWALVINRSDSGPLAKYQVAALFGLVMLDGTDVTVQAGLMPIKAEDASKWAELGRGLIALGQLQPDNPELREVAAKAKVANTPDGKSATLTIAVDQDKLLKATDKKAKKKK